VLELVPSGRCATRVANHLRAGQVCGVDPVPVRRVRATTWGVEVFDPSEGTDDLLQEIREHTDGRGPDAVIDAVGMEASGHGVVRLAQRAVSLMPKETAAKLVETAGIDRLAAFR